MTKYLLFVTLLLSCGLLYAESNPPPAPWYEVEIILFENSPQKERFKEALNEQSIVPELINAMELTAPFIPTEGGIAVEAAYQRLAQPQLQLSDIAKKIEKRSAYKLLLHMGWRQPGLARDLAPAILIYPYATDQFISEEQYLGRSEAEPKLTIFNGESATRSDVPPLAHEVGVLPVVTVDQWHDQAYVFGYIRLFLSRYLHIESDLLLSKPIKVPPHHLLLDDIAGLMSGKNSDYYFDSPDQLLATQEIPLRHEHAVRENYYFRIDENRRLRKEELHYFDHPRFGMLIVVRDYKPPVEGD